MARTFEEKLVKYLVDEYCQGDRKEFAERVGYYKSQVWTDQSSIDTQSPLCA